MKPSDSLYKTAGVDTAATQSGLHKIIERVKATWPPSGELGAVQLDIGYFANVIDVGGIGLAISTDGVGSKSVIAQMMRRYDTIGIDCVAMNVNDLLCVGARPISLGVSGAGILARRRSSASSPQYLQLSRIKTEE